VTHDKIQDDNNNLPIQIGFTESMSSNESSENENEDEIEETSDNTNETIIDENIITEE
jgi:hypothetical protein